VAGTIVDFPAVSALKAA